jgi:hypothetical protein
MAYRAGPQKHQVITERGLAKHVSDSEVLFALYNRKGELRPLPTNRGAILEKDKIFYFLPEGSKEEFFSFKKGKTSVGFLVKYPSTCKTEGQFYRFYDFA